jgi:hypothetical protein
VTRYERTYGTDWETLDIDAAVDRAYGIGVGERLGDDDRPELERIYAAFDTAYEKSLIELAYDEGRSEAMEAASENDTDDELWHDLVAGEPATVDTEDVPTGGREGLPTALDVSEVLDLTSPDSTERLDLPEFLDR